MQHDQLYKAYYANITIEEEFDQGRMREDNSVLRTSERTLESWTGGGVGGCTRFENRADNLCDAVTSTRAEIVQGHVETDPRIALGDTLEEDIPHGG